MQITLTAHSEQLLRAALARSPGRSPAEIVEQALAERAERETATLARARLPEPTRLSSEEFQGALDRMARFSDKIPALPIEAFSRESFYEDHD